MDSNPPAATERGPARRTEPESEWWRPPPGALAMAGWALIPLRLFLGITFLFAGMQKLANPAFFQASNPSSIASQLVGSQRTSPVGGLMGPLVSHANLIGVLISLAELAIGFGVLFGLWTRVAACAGLALSFGLFLTVSFHSSPYFTGSDIVFVFAWTPFIVAGAGGAPSVDTWLAQRASGQGPSTRLGDNSGTGFERRAVLSKGSVAGIAAGMVLATGGIAAWIGRLAGSSSTTSSASASLAPSPTTLATSPGSSTGAGSSTTTTPTGIQIGTVAQLPAGSATQFSDPSTGQPAILIHDPNGEFKAFEAICPHAGCTVGYSRSAKLIACPCHGSEFNALTGALVRGPATKGLASIPIESSNGAVYLRST